MYFRGGNTTDELVCVVLVRDGAPMRYFPIGAKSDVHVPLRVVEDLDGGTASSCSSAGAGGRHRASSSSTSAWWRSDVARRRSDDDGRRDLVVIGNGMAGARTVEEILERGGARQFDITMFGEEPYGNYNRIMLSNVLAGRRGESAIFLNACPGTPRTASTLRAGVRVDADRPATREVYADDGTARSTTS